MYLQKHCRPMLLVCVSSACATIAPLPGGLVPSTMPTDGTGLREFTVSSTLARGEACADSLLFIISLESDSSLYLAKKRALQEATADFLVDVTVDIYSLNVLYLYHKTCTIVRGRGAYYPRAARQASSPPASAASGSTAQHLSARPPSTSDAFGAAAQHPKARPPSTSEVDAQLLPLRDRLVACRDNFAPQAQRAWITLTIEPSGRTKVNSVQHDGGTGDDKFSGCLNMVLEPLQFPAFQGEPTTMQTIVNL